MELLVGVLQHSHRHASRHIDTFSLQSGSRVGDQFGLEGRVTPSLSDDLTEFWIISFYFYFWNDRKLIRLVAKVA